jgi:hypothetical protein
VVAAQTFTPLMSAALVFPAGGRRRAEYTLAPGLHSGDGISREWMRCHLGRGSATQAAVPESGTRVCGAGVRAGPLSTEFCHLAGEVLVMLQKCSAV